MTDDDNNDDDCNASSSQTAVTYESKISRRTWRGEKKKKQEKGKQLRVRILQDVGHQVDESGFHIWWILGRSFNKEKLLLFGQFLLMIEHKEGEKRLRERNKHEWMGEPVDQMAKGLFLTVAVSVETTFPERSFLLPTRMMHGFARLLDELYPWCLEISSSQVDKLLNDCLFVTSYTNTIPWAPLHGP